MGKEMTNADNQNYQQTIDEIEYAFCNGEYSKWDDIVATLLPDNLIHYTSFEHGFWLTRARHMRDPARRVPYCGSEIGMAKEPQEGKKNRWGDMFYLSTDMQYNSAFNEADIIKKGENGTLGYFYINEYLNLFDATKSRASANTKETICGVNIWEALFALLVLIDKWFNATENENNEQVYQITNHVAELIRTRTNLDGLVYKSSKNKNDQSWNVALVNDHKVEWGYSELLVPDILGRYRKKALCKSSNYEKMKQFTKERLELELNQKRSYPKQARSILTHKFP